MAEHVTLAEQQRVEAALAVIIARVRCREIHNQHRWGRCIQCISWAERIGVPANLPRMLAALVPTPVRPVRDAGDEQGSG